MTFNRRYVMPLLAASFFAVSLTVAPAVMAQEKTLRVRFYDDPAGFDPANIFRTENENIAYNILPDNSFSGI